MITVVYLRNFVPICRRTYLNVNYPNAALIEQVSTEINGHSPWLAHISSIGDFEDSLSLNIDYALYAKGEAMLGYLDQQISIEGELPNTQEAALYLAEDFAYRLKKIHACIGHVKFWLNGKKISYTATGEDGTAYIETKPSLSCEMIINARVQMDDVALKLIMEEAIVSAAEKFDVKIGVLSSAHFKPGYPKPQHRIA